MLTIRGATTVLNNTEKEIQRAVEELLTVILQKNNLQKSEIVTVLCTSTTDITAAYPVKYVRLFGLQNATFFSMIEPDIQNSLPLCIRLLLFVDKSNASSHTVQNLIYNLQIASFIGDTKLNDEILSKIQNSIKQASCMQPYTVQKAYTVEHIYLRGAKFLRTDIQKINIAIDGPAGSGKSSLAKLLAKELGIYYLDTGAMYRATTYYLLKNGVDIENTQAIALAVQNLPLQVYYADKRQCTAINGQDVSNKIRTAEIAMQTAKVAQNPAVRQKLVAMQQQIAKQYSCIVDGRDIGYNVLPNAQYKFFLTASAEIRAERRMAELQAKGEQVDYPKLLQEIIERDKQDAEREVAPLKVAEDAIVIDSSMMTLQQVLQKVKTIVLQ